MKHSGVFLFKRIAAQGQTSVEFLITTAGVFLAFWGVSICFETQMKRYLSLLFELLRLPF